MRVYAVTAGSWDSFRIEAMFATEAEARRYIAGCGPREYPTLDAVNDRVQVWEVFETAEDARTDWVEQCAEYPHVIRDRAYVELP